MTDTPQPVGRCQHCQQIRPVFHYDHKHDNGDHIWDTPYPDYWPNSGAWLCARDYSDADTARINGRTFHVDHELEIWPGKEAKTRTFMGGREVLTQADQDLRTCEAILTATRDLGGAR